jgi:hypothetical protein
MRCPPLQCPNWRCSSNRSKTVVVHPRRPLRTGCKKKRQRSRGRCIRHLRFFINMDKHKTVSKPPRKNVHENCKKKIKPYNTRNFTTWRGDERSREAQVLAISRHSSNDKITAQTNSNKRTTYMRDEEKREYLILFQSKRIQAPDARDHQA